MKVDTYHFIEILRTEFMIHNSWFKQLAKLSKNKKQEG